MLSGNSDVFGAGWQSIPNIPRGWKNQDEPPLALDPQGLRQGAFKSIDPSSESLQGAFDASTQDFQAHPAGNAVPGFVLFKRRHFWGSLAGLRAAGLL